MQDFKLNKTYVYEHADGVTYAREFGASATERFEIGRTVKRQTTDDELKEAKLWANIHRVAKSNPALQDALDRVKIIYELSKDNGEK